jgi:hypothetical protein
VFLLGVALTLTLLLLEHRLEWWVHKQKRKR